MPIQRLNLAPGSDTVALYSIHFARWEPRPLGRGGKRVQCLPALISLDMFIVQVYHAANADLNAALNIKAAGQAVLACGEAA